MTTFDEDKPFRFPPMKDQPTIDAMLADWGPYLKDPVTDSMITDDDAGGKVEEGMFDAFEQAWQAGNRAARKPPEPLFAFHDIVENGDGTANLIAPALPSQGEVMKAQHDLLEGIAQIAENHGFKRGDDLQVWLAKNLPKRGEL